MLNKFWAQPLRDLSSEISGKSLYHPKRENKSSVGRGERYGIQKQPQECVGNAKGGLKGLPPEKVAMGAGACRLARIREASHREAENKPRNRVET